jgi:predicted N-formylglutamate amidohydrolase
MASAKRPRPVELVLTCEHGGNEIPPPYRHLFVGAGDVLKSHRGWDPGALRLAKYLSQSLGATLFYSTTSRLLIELNRSLHHPDLFSSYTRDLSHYEKLSLVVNHYSPHRNEVERTIAAAIDDGRRVLHVGVHTFTPELDGRVRTADIGLLYDPARAWEVELCDAWRKSILLLNPTLRVRKNYPYLGKSDGFTTYLRKQFPKTHYAGVELEVNQRIAANQRLPQTLSDSLHTTLRSGSRYRGGR